MPYCLHGDRPSNPLIQHIKQQQGRDGDLYEHHGWYKSPHTLDYLPLQEAHSHVAVTQQPDHNV